MNKSYFTTQWIAARPAPKIITDVRLVDLVETIQDVRPKGRGFVIHRRVVAGIPSKIIYQVGDSLLMHPAKEEEIRRTLADSLEQSLHSALVFGSAFSVDPLPAPPLDEALTSEKIEELIRRFA